MKEDNKETISKNIQFIRNGGLWIASILVIFIAFFIINYLTPAVADDFYYRGYLKNFPDGGDNVLKTFWQLLRGFYNSWSGRVMGYTFMVVFNIIPPVVFDLINSAAYIFLVYLIYKISNFGKKPDLKLFILINIFLWIFIPDYGQIMFWTSGSANYLYPAVFDLIVLLVFRKYSFEKGQCFKCILWILPALILGIIAGCGMENISAGMIIILTLYMVVFIKNKIVLNPMVTTLYLGCIAGYCILFFSPGNSARAGIEDNRSNLSFLFKCFITGYYWVFFGLGIFTVMLIFWLLKYKKIIYMKHNEEIQSYFYYISSILSAVCLIAAPSIPERAWFISAVYGVTSAGIFFANLDKPAEEKRAGIIKDISFIITVCGCIFCVVSIADTAICSYELHKQSLQREKYIIEQKEAGNMDISVPVISYKYPLRSGHDALSSLADISEDSSYWINQAMAGYYGVNSVTGIKAE